MTRGYVALLLVVALAAGAAGYFLSRPSAPRIDGIACESMEAHGFHIHVHLEVWKEGTPVPVPAGIGFAPGCFYWLHTHTPDGIVHVEAPSGPFTLGQFFEIWGAQAPKFDGEVHLSVDAGDGRGYQKVEGDWRSLALTDRTLISMGTGTFSPRGFVFPEEL